MLAYEGTRMIFCGDSFESVSDPPQGRRGVHPGGIEAMLRPMSTKELEMAVRELPPDEFASFASWFEDYLADRVPAALGFT